MKTTKTNTATQNETKKTTLGKEVCTLFRSKSKDGKEYLSGELAEDKEVKIVAFFNSIKKNPKEPDIRLYQKGNVGSGKEIASLWKGEKCYTGSDNEKKKLVGFDNVSKKSGISYIKVYYQKGE